MRWCCCQHVNFSRNSSRRCYMRIYYNLRKRLSCSLVEYVCLRNSRNTFLITSKLSTNLFQSARSDSSLTVVKCRRMWNSSRKLECANEQENQENRDKEKLANSEISKKSDIYDFDFAIYSNFSMTSLSLSLSHHHHLFWLHESRSFTACKIDFPLDDAISPWERSQLMLTAGGRRWMTTREVLKTVQIFDGAQKIRKTFPHVPLPALLLFSAKKNGILKKHKLEKQQKKFNLIPPVSLYVNVPLLSFFG